MYDYTMVQWLFFFYFYCFAGWCFESAYVSVKSRELTNRGFLRGPFLPIYGSGAIMMLVVSMPFQDNIFLTYCAGCVGATILEYVTGVTMEALFQVRYWDYSKNRFNFQGHICLGSSLAWGILTILMTEVIHVRVEKLVLSVPEQVMTVVTCVLTAALFADFALSFKAAIDLRNVLVKMEQAKEEMMHIRRKLDMMIALADQEWEEYKAEHGEDKAESGTGRKAAAGQNGKGESGESAVLSLEEIREGIESRLENLKHRIQTRPSGYLESKKEEILELKTRYHVNVEMRKGMGVLRDFFQRDMLRANPGMTSAKFKEALEELKQKASRKRGNGES